jgi:hypothetical protein
MQPIFNKDRDAINAALFQERCETLYNEIGTTADSIMIYSDEIEVQNGSGTYVPFKNCKTFWEGCGEDNIKTGEFQGRMDPVLRLYRSCRLMLPINMNVSKGQANGSQVTLEKVVLKEGVVPQEVLLDGVPVNAVRASQVDHLVLKQANDRIEPQEFSVAPTKYSFIAHVLKPTSLQVKGNEREKLKMKATQLPVLVNNATTGHKLQGCSVDNVFVHSWSMVRNWTYVMLSRVRTRAGLFCRHKLPKDLSKYAVPPALQRMLERFRGRCRPSYWSDEQYDDILDE